MKPTRNTLLVLLLLARYSPPSAADNSPALLQAAFKEHCVKCHGTGDRIEAEINLLALLSGDDRQARPRFLERVVTVLKDRQMPPEDEPPLQEDKRRKMIAQLQAMLTKVQKTQAFGPTPIRRMNRFQYNNAVVDLLELDRDIFQLNERLLRRRDDYFRPETGEMPSEVRVSSRPLAKDIDNQRPEGFRGVAAFPQDKRAEHGFDNRAEYLTLSPLLMESFLQLSHTIVDSPDLNPTECRSWDRLFAAPGHPARGLLAGRYEAESEGPIRFETPAKGRAAPQNMQGFGSDWSGHAQLFWQCPEQGLEITLSFEATEAGSGLTFAFTKAPDYGTFGVYLDDEQIGEPIDLYDPKVLHTQRDVSDLKIKTGPHTLKFICVGKSDQSTNYFFGLDSIDVTGREPPPDSEPTDIADIDTVRSRLEKLLRRAFRRPVDDGTLDRFTTFAESQLASGASFEDTMRTVVGAVLGMPDFLYFYETPDLAPKGDDEKSRLSASRNRRRVTDSKDSKDADASGLPLDETQDFNRRQRINDVELASRLAQYLWSSIPDDTLLDLAEVDTLSDPETLSTQIDRMMNDRRSSRFCDSFPCQWLQLDRLITSIPDPEKFPYFYYHGYRTSIHMLSEPLLLFDTVYIEDRTIMDLLDPRFTWQSDMLRANYEGKSTTSHQVQVQVFKRIPIDDPRRGGVMTNAAVMTMTSTPTRTQPITRGAWVNSVIFNDPPKPPPADVPPLPEANAEELSKLTIRERLAVHRKRADCAGCHNKIDPLGFALENYGPTGVWRDEYENGRKVDVSGMLFNQHEFETVVEFKRLILDEKERFIRGFVAHVLSYALGRKLGPADSPALDEITSKATAGHDQMRAVLKSVAMSEPFLHKNTGDQD